MAAPRAACWLVLLLLVAVAHGLDSGYVTYDEVRGKPYEVTYDGRSLMLNGARSLFLSGAAHYPRATPAMWPQIAANAKRLGLNMVETYAFWNVHEPQRGELIWEGGANLTAYIETFRDAGLFVMLRIGPYVCAEYDYGGLPTWLGLTPGMRFRESNKPWLDESRRWFRTVLEQVAPLFPSSGGPIVLVQVENELYGASEEYVQWNGDMAAQELERAGLSVPVIMCNGQSANNTINTCNAQQCVSFLETNGQNGRVLIDQPALLTELEGGYQVWGESTSHALSYFFGRSPEDTSFAVARWFARGGSLNNYYMLFGGSNFGLTAGNSMTTAYAQDAPVCSDGLPHEPHFSHFARLHRALAARAATLLQAPAQLRHGVRLEYYDGKQWKADDDRLTAFVYEHGDASAVGFLENAGSDASRLVHWRGAEFTLAPLSIVLADADSHEVLFNSSDVEPATEQRVIEPADVAADQMRWEWWPEPLSPADTGTLAGLVRSTPAEQTSVTLGQTDYLWYESNVTLPDADSPLVLRVETSTSLSLVAWLNGTLAAKPVDNHDHDAGLETVQHELELRDAPDGCFGSTCLLTLLSVAIGGAPNYPIDPGSTRMLRGIVGNVSLGGEDITSHDTPWRMRPGLAGEHRSVTLGGRIPWAAAGSRTQFPPGTWLRTRFATPGPLPPASACLLNLTGLGRGHAYLNGHDLGRYWLLPRNDGSGLPSQRYYHVPPDWLAEPDALNELVLFEDEGAPDVSLVGVAVSRMAPRPVRLLSRAELRRGAVTKLATQQATRMVQPCEF